MRCTHRRRHSCRELVVAALLAISTTTAARAVDIFGVEPAALDQPRINAYVSLTASGAPLVAEFGGLQSFNIQAYYDTGASGVLLSTNTADLLGINRSTHNAQDVIFSDVGVAGTSDFYVSTPIHIALAPYHPDADVDNFDTHQTVYNQRFGPVRTQMGPAGIEPDPALGDLDVFGMPTMAGKVVVMDPRPVNSFLDTMRTYVYDPGTAYRPGQQHTNPGIPTVDRHVKLSYASFDRFTQTTPAGAAGPTLRNNPFIGPNPFNAADTTPAVKLTFGGASVDGSFLLDTGAAASMISTTKAGALGIAYDQDTLGTDHPILLWNGVAIEDQFQLTIGGIGGSKVVAGFYLDSLLLRTEEGNANDLADPNHINFLRAPVLVSDISVANPDNPSDVYTLDGIFGMNFFVASASLAGVDASGVPLIGNLVRGQFDWVTFDEPAGKLGLKVAPPIPQDRLEWFGDYTNINRSYWDDTSGNWIVGISSGAGYEEGDQVYFGNGAFADTIRLNLVLAPGGVTFENDYDPESDAGINYDLIGSGRITGFGGLLKRGSGDVRIFTPNNYTGATVVEAGRLQFYASQVLGPLSIHDGGSVLLASGPRQAFETISVAGTLVADASPVIVTKAIFVDAASGQFEMNDSKIVVDYQPGSVHAAAVQIRSVLDAGGKDGHGLVSRLVEGNARLAIGYTDAAAKFGASPTTWNGESIDGTALLIAVTRLGDANLDFIVNFDDLLVLSQNYGESDRFWWQADFNYDGSVNFDDLLALAQSYGGSRVLDAGTFTDARFAADWALATALVPEPASLLMLVAAPLLGRRRR